MALSLRLAAYIAPRVTGGDPFKLGMRALELYAVEMSKAKKNASNEQKPGQEADNEFISGR